MNRSYPTNYDLVAYDSFKGSLILAQSISRRQSRTRRRLLVHPNVIVIAS